MTCTSASGIRSRGAATRRDDERDSDRDDGFECEHGDLLERRVWRQRSERPQNQGRPGAFEPIA